MALLIGRGAILTLALLAGCYDPQLEDCTVTCAAPDDCADGQVCGADGFCAQPSVAGTCAAPPTPSTLRVAIERKGRVTLADPAFTCTADGNGGTQCDVLVPQPGWVDLRAIQTDRPFDRWTSSSCADQPSSCRLWVGPGLTSVTARF